MLDPAISSLNFSKIEKLISKVASSDGYVGSRLSRASCLDRASTIVMLRDGKRGAVEEREG